MQFLQQCVGVLGKEATALFRLLQRAGFGRTEKLPDESFDAFFLPGQQEVPELFRLFPGNVGGRRRQLGGEGEAGVFSI